MALLMRLHEAGHTILLVTHDETIAARADAVRRMEDGRLLPDCR